MNSQPPRRTCRICFRPLHDMTGGDICPVCAPRFHHGHPSIAIEIDGDTLHFLPGSSEALRLGIILPPLSTPPNVKHTSAVGVSFVREME